jgi:hypothetical protein
LIAHSHFDVPIFVKLRRKLLMEYPADRAFTEIEKAFDDAKL